MKSENAILNVEKLEDLDENLLYLDELEEKLQEQLDFEISEFEFLKKEEAKYISILSNIGLNEDRKKELRHRLDIIKEIMNEMQ